MTIAGTLAGPQETLAILQESKIVADIDPILIFFRERNAGNSARDVGDHEVESRLRAIEALNGKVFRVRQPVYAWNIDVGFGAGVDLFAFPSSHGGNEDVDDRICSAGW